MKAPIPQPNDFWISQHGISRVVARCDVPSVTLEYVDGQRAHFGVGSLMHGEYRSLHDKNDAEMWNMLLGGKTIAVEGPDGAGKTTMAKALTERLNFRGLMAFYDREPGGTPFGDEIRKVLREGNYELDGLQEAALFIAAHRHLVQKIKMRRHNKGNDMQDPVTVLDRSVWLSLPVYQSARGADRGELFTVMDAMQVTPPDIVIVLDQDDRVLDERIRADDDKSPRFEGDESFIRAVRQNYRTAFTYGWASKLPDYRVVFTIQTTLTDWQKSLDELVSEVEELLTTKYIEWQWNHAQDR